MGGASFKVGKTWTDPTKREGESTGVTSGTVVGVRPGLNAGASGVVASSVFEWSEGLQSEELRVRRSWGIGASPGDFRSDWRPEQQLTFLDNYILTQNKVVDKILGQFLTS